MIRRASLAAIVCTCACTPILGLDDITYVDDPAPGRASKGAAIACDATAGAADPDAATCSPGACCEHAPDGWRCCGPDEDVDCDDAREQVCPGD